jgi:hypothetical protein
MPLAEPAFCIGIGEYQVAENVANYDVYALR